MEIPCRLILRSLEGEASKRLEVSRQSLGKLECQFMSKFMLRVVAGHQSAKRACLRPAGSSTCDRLHSAPEDQSSKSNPQRQISIDRPSQPQSRPHSPSYSTAKSAIMVAMYTIFGRQVGSHYVCQACHALIITAVPAHCMQLLLRSKTKADSHHLSLQLALATLVGTGAIATWAVSGEKKQPTPVNQSSNKDEEEFIQYVVFTRDVPNDEAKSLPSDG